MPKGWSRPEAKVSIWAALPSGVDAAEDDRWAGAGVGEEEIAVGGGADEAGFGEGAAGVGHVLDDVRALEGAGVAAGVEGDFESGGCDGPGVGGLRDEVRLVLHGLFRLGRGEVGEGESYGGRRAFAGSSR